MKIIYNTIFFDEILNDTDIKFLLLAFINVVVIRRKDKISIMNGPNISLPFSCFKNSIKNLYVTLEVSIKDSTYSFFVRV